MEKSGIIYRTDNYKLFKKLQGNRQVPKSRVDKIKRSISNVGYVKSPIIVNEKMEVIDGQGRLEALKQMQLPVDYIVVNGAGIAECRSMNINQSNWVIMDFVQSYADNGNVSYKYLLNLMRAYKGIGIIAVNNAITGLSSTNNNAIKNGEFVCTEDDYNNAVKILENEKSFQHIVRKMKGRVDYIYIAIGFCYQHSGVDNERLYEKFSENYERFLPPANIEQALDEISKIYNERLRGPKLYLSTDYKRKMEESYGWYDKIWGSRARHYVG